MHYNELIYGHVRLCCEAAPVEKINGKHGEVFLYGHIYKGKERLIELLKEGSYELLGSWLPDCDGSFAIIYYDRNLDVINLYTDKWGGKIFYICKSNGLISDRLTGCLPEVRKLNCLAAAEFVAFYGFIQGDKTLVDGVIKAQPAMRYQLYREPGELLSSQYWLPKFYYSNKTTKNKTKKSLKEAWVEVFDDIINWIGDKKIICPISAGLDSRAILAELARRGLQKQVYTVTFSLMGKYELKMASEIAKSLGFRHKHLLIENNAIFKESNYSELAAAHDYQIWNTPYVPAELHRNMAQFGDVLLSGFGGDPMMGSHLIKTELSLNEYLFDKYRWLHDEELRSEQITKDKDLLESFNTSVKKFNSENILCNYDAWYFSQRNTNMTQHSVLGFRNCYEIITPFMDSRIYNAVSDMAPEQRLNRKLFSELMAELYPKAFSLRSSAQRGKIYDARFFVERVIAVATRKLLGYSIIDNSFDYKPDMNERFRRVTEFRSLILNNAHFVVQKGLVSKKFVDDVTESLLSGKRNGVHNQQRFPVLCALSSLSVNIRELGIEVE